MKVLVVGGGGREHAIVDALTRSGRIDTIYCAPGNAGIAAQAECVPIRETEVEALRDFALAHNVTLTVVMYKEVQLDVKFIDGGGATSSDVSYTIDPETITLSGDATALEGVNTILLDNIDLSAIMKNEDTVLRQIIIPNNATNVSGEQEAKITLRIKNKEISTIRSSNITFTGVTEGLEAKSIAQQLQVTYRASSEDVKRISANNVRIVADMTEFTQPGTYQVPVEVYFDGFSGAGVIGDYTVAVTLSRIEE